MRRRESTCLHRRPTPTIENRLNLAERREIFDTVWQTVNEGYFDSDFGGKDWQAIGERYRQMLATVEDDHTFWLEVLNPMLFELEVSHVAALPPEFSNQMEPMTFSAGILGMDMRWLDGQLVITEVVARFPADQAKLRPGFVVTSVDGWTAEEIAAVDLQSPPDNERNRRANLAQGIRTATGRRDDVW
ncbi:MAG: hypothetical protein U9R25_10365 [Chloroflexota bacterium]|nr:hypothetical protein [Chloroflexota bacterium]